MNKKKLRVCEAGHRYYKSSDCPVCPLCEEDKKVDSAFSFLAAPARRALHNAGINSLEQVAGFSEHELLELHGFGPGSLPKLKAGLRAKGLDFPPTK